MGGRATQTFGTALAAALGALLLLAATAGAATLPRPASAWARTVTENTVVLEWRPAAGAAAYEVRRGRVLVSRVASPGTQLRITQLDPAAYREYTVTAVAGARRSIASDPVPVTTLAPTACTHWVSDAGSDAAAGTQAAPWRTIERLVEAWEAGQVGCLTGSFTEDVTIRRGGSEGRPVVLRSTPGATAVIHGRVWIADGADHVVVAHLRLDGRANVGESRDDLPSPTVNGDHALLIGNDISNARTRVCVVLGSIRGYGTTSDTVLAYNRVHDCGERSADGLTTVNTHHGIYVESTERLRIVDNVIYDNADRGIQLYPNARGSLIMGNVIDRNGEGIIFSGAEGYASSGNRVLRNVISNSRIRSNLEHYWESPSSPGEGNVAVRNCLGGAREGNIATPTVGYVARANSTGTLRWRNRVAGDFRPLGSSGCRELLRTGALPLRPFAG